jgi:hypothetical protein
LMNTVGRARLEYRKILWTAFADVNSFFRHGVARRRSWRATFSHLFPAMTGLTVLREGTPRDDSLRGVRLSHRQMGRSLCLCCFLPRLHTRRKRYRNYA